MLVTDEPTFVREDKCYSCGRRTQLYVKFGVAEIGGQKIPYQFWQDSDLACRQIQDITFEREPMPRDFMIEQIKGKLSSFHLTPSYSRSFR